MPVLLAAKKAKPYSFGIVKSLLGDIMDKYSVLHQSDSRFSFPVSDTAAVIRLRVKRNDDFKRVDVIWNTTHKFGQERLEMPMTLSASDELFDYYTATLDNGYPGYSYLFRFTDFDDSVWYYNESGFDRTLYVTQTFQDNFTVVFPNASDVVLPNKKFEGRVFYQIFPERFNKSQNKAYTSYINMDWYTEEPRNDVFAGGDLDGIAEKLPYLKDLGVGAIYMTPIHPSISAHKYDVDDYFDVDKMFGGLPALKNLVEQAHKQDILVVMDLVFNHSSYLNPLFQDVVKNGKKSKYYNWYFVDGDKPDWDKLNYKTFCDVNMMPKLNTNNPQVMDYLSKVGEFYLDMGVDGFRMDVAFDVSHAFWQYFKYRMKQKKSDVFIIGEDWQNSESFLGNDQWDSVMNYPFLYACQRYFAYKRYDAKAFADYLNNTLMRYKDGTNRNMLNLIDSHDIERFYNTVGFDNDLELMTIAALTFYLGSPMLYYGDEIFMEGKQDPYNRKAMRWNSTAFESVEFQTVKRLLNMRQNDILRLGDISVWAKDDVAYIRRTHGGQSLTLALNYSGEDKTVCGKVVFGRNVSGNVMHNKAFAVIEQTIAS